MVYTGFTQYQKDEMIKKAIDQRIAQIQDEDDELEDCEEVEYNRK